MWNLLKMKKACYPLDCNVRDETTLWITNWNIIRERLALV
jgi:hypothetical protein